MRINWNEPKFGEEELKEVSDVINSNYINEGPKTKELEEEIKKYLGVKYVILTTNATAALFLAVKADALIKQKENFEVLIPDLTMIATATAVGWAGGRPILVDVFAGDGTINTDIIEDKINSNTIAIIPVHVLGRSANMNRLKEIAEKHNLTIIEDAAGALGSKLGENYLGTIGKVGCFSLQSNKIVTSGQGGIIVTNDDRYYELIRRLRDFGRFSNKEFLHEIEGYNLKFNDLSAALALAQFRKINERKELLLRQREIYERELHGLKEVHFFLLRKGEIPLWIDITCEERAKLVSFLNTFEIFPRECWPAIHMNSPYKNQGGDIIYLNSSSISDNCLWLPNGPAISEEQIKFICEKISEFYNQKKLKKIHEDERGGIYLIENMLEDGKEFTFLELKEGYARGGCIHSKEENLVVVKGSIKFICGNEKRLLVKGESAVIPAFKPHAFIGMSDSIVVEWGITSAEKNMDKKDLKLREIVDSINKEAKKGHDK